jgi:hypothetical protein
LDPRAHPYHHAPLVLVLAVAEARAARAFPWMTVGLSALLAVTLYLWDTAAWTQVNAVYLAWALPATAVLAALALGVRSRPREHVAAGP